MMRALVVVMVIVVAAFGLYQVKYRVHTLRTQIADVQQQIEAEREHLHVVAAEWTYLTRPDRLKRLAERYTQLQPLSSRQVVAGVEAIPFAPPALAAEDALPVSPVAHVTVEGQ